jgi:hypothetical protein
LAIELALSIQVKAANPAMFAGERLEGQGEGAFRD